MRGKKASFLRDWNLRGEQNYNFLDRFNIIRLPSKQVCLYDKLCRSVVFFFGNGFDQIPTIFGPEMTYRRGCY